MDLWESVLESYCHLASRNGREGGLCLLGVPPRKILAQSLDILPPLKVTEHLYWICTGVMDPQHQRARWSRRLTGDELVFPSECRCKALN
jgi:hypothetical protein